MQIGRWRLAGPADTHLPGTHDPEGTPEVGTSVVESMSISPCHLATVSRDIRSDAPLCFSVCVQIGYSRVTCTLNQLCVLRIQQA